jgi:Na+-transporting NADH:ubiquinone oxidoreductase subunit A
MLRQLTTGKHLNVQAIPPAPFSQAQNVQINTISGPHPAGNVGVQIHIDPINKEIVWYINPQDVVIMGNYLMKEYDLLRTYGYRFSG